MSITRPFRHTQAGLTLLELIAVLLIVGFLLKLAMPSYTDYVRRGQLPEGLTTLADLRIKMEQYYQDNRKYGTTDCADGANAPAWNSFASSTYFSYSCALSASGQGYLLTATGRAGQARGHAYTLDHNNAKVTVTFKASNVNKACWLMRGDEC